MNKVIILISIFCYTSTTFAYTKLPLKIKCSKEVKKFFKKQKYQNKFTEVFKPAATIIRSPTKKIGHWVQASYSKKKYEHLWLFQPAFRQKYNIDRNCKISLNYKKAYAHKESPFKDFTDSDLQNLLKKKNGLIYLMNPSFVYSVKHLEKAHKFAKSKKLEFTVLLTSRSHFQKNKEKIKQERFLASASISPNEIKTNRSTELKLRQTELHSPTYVFTKKENS